METIKLIAIFTVMFLSLWSMGNLFADSVSDHEVISPKPGIECIIVSRMFNTSVDCWAVD